jgi:hypothetical protein
LFRLHLDLRGRTVAKLEQPHGRRLEIALTQTFPHQAFYDRNFRIIGHQIKAAERIV